MTFYAVTYTTESGDEGFVGVFNEYPTDGHLAAIAKADFPHEIIEEDGELYKLIYFKVFPLDGILSLPEPIEPIDGA